MINSIKKNIMHYVYLFIIVSLSFVSFTNAQEQNNIAAFKGAEGGGALSIGGRGGSVYEVVNLNDHGVGSLRYGLEHIDGPRTIVFKVAGYIHLERNLSIIDDSFITIAGQTAPGDGITIVFPSNPNLEVWHIRNSHDIIIRYLRIRKGGAPADTYNQAGSNISIIGDTHDIVFDHCSIGWAGDENFGAYNVHPEGQIVPYNISFQWSITSENLRRRVLDDSHMTDSTGLFFGSSTKPESSVNVSVHHNLFARNNNRNPLLKIGSADFDANIVYNWGWYATGISGGIDVDIADNFYKPGPARSGGNKRPEISFKYAEEGIPGTGVFSNPSIYLNGNVGPHNSNPENDEWDTMMHEANEDWGFKNGNDELARVNKNHRRLEKHIFEFPIKRENALELDQILLSDGGVGASKVLSESGAWVNNRDLVDTRVINDFNNGTGEGLVSSVDMVGGWPYWDGESYKYASEEEFLANPESFMLKLGTPYSDQDHDGMSDLWEDNNGLDKNNPDDRNEDLNNNGYTNLEEFLNGVAGIKPPVRSNGLPKDSQESSAESIILSLQTEKKSICKYSIFKDVTYSEMEKTFNNDDNNNHTINISGLEKGKEYNYYVKCIDEFGNENTYDYVISFKVLNIVEKQKKGYSSKIIKKVIKNSNKIKKQDPKNKVKKDNSVRSINELEELKNSLIEEIKILKLKIEILKIQMMIKQYIDKT